MKLFKVVIGINPYPKNQGTITHATIEPQKIIAGHLKILMGKGRNGYFFRAK